MSSTTDPRRLAAILLHQRKTFGRVDGRPMQSLIAFDTRASADAFARFVPVPGYVGATFNERHQAVTVFHRPGFETRIAEFASGLGGHYIDAPA